MSVEIPKTEKEIQELLNTLQDHVAYNKQVLAKAESKIAKYQEAIQSIQQQEKDARAKMEETLRKLQAEIQENESKLKQYVETKTRSNNRLDNANDLVPKLHDALKSVRMAKAPLKPKYASDQFSDDDNE
jgi:chromosome segregation ATPase